MTPKELLASAAEEWVSARSQYRDRALRVGGLLVEFIRGRLEAGLGKTEPERRSLGATRSSATTDAASALGISVQRVNDLIRTSEAARLLGPVGNLSYSSLRIMRLLIYRPSKGVKKSRRKNNADGLPSAQETWVIRPLFNKTGPATAAAAVAGNWNERRVAEAIRGLVRPTAHKRSKAPLKHSKDVYTIGMVAKICTVAPRTAAKWFDKGFLKGYKVPGSRDRRVLAHDLRAFLVNNECPIPRELFGVEEACFGMEKAGPGLQFECPFEFGACCEHRGVRHAYIGTTLGYTTAVAAARFALSHGVEHVSMVLADDQVPPEGLNVTVFRSYEAVA